MPRDAITGVYTLPLPATEPRRIPVTGWANTTVEDLAAAMSNIPGGAIANGAVTNAKTDLSSGLRIRGTGVAPANTAWIGFYEADGATRSGYVGDDGSGHTVRLTIDNAAGESSLRVANTDAVKAFIDRVELPAGRLQFPATQNPSSNANTLDDYEEGTWTPTLSFSTPGDQVIAYNAANRSGQYQKVGNTVHFQFRLDTTTFTHTTAAGFLTVLGIPFIPKDLGYPGDSSGWIYPALISGLMHPTSSFFPYLALQSGVANFFLGVCTGAAGVASTNVVSNVVHASGVNVIIMGTGSFQV